MNAFQTFGPLFNLSGTSQRGEQTPGVSSQNGSQLRDQGINQVSNHNENWMERCLHASKIWVEARKLWQWDFTGEDLRIDLEFGIGKPSHPNAWGALISTLIKRKIIVPTGEYRAMKDSSSHARKTPVYKAAY